MTEPIKVPSNFTEVLMALILPYRKPLEAEPQFIELKGSQEGLENLDLVVVESNQLTYIPSKEGSPID